jgi:hypothetical protein
MLKPMSYRSLFIFCFFLGTVNIAWCGRIIYPWNATTAMVKTGESFTIWYDADEGESIEFLALQGPYNTIRIAAPGLEKGCWVYDKMSGNTYNLKIEVKVPAGTPEELYDLVLNTSSGQVVSQRAVKVIREYRKTYTIFHISDTHICDESYREADGVPGRLRWLSALVDMANLIGSEIVFLTGDNVNSRSWDDGNADYLTTWPSTRERVDFYYKGSHDHGLNGVHDFHGAAFSVNGNHDQYERPPDGRETQNKFTFWNTYHGLRTHHFAYGDTRFMAFSDAFGEELQHQAASHTNWLKEVGPGKLRVIYKHFYHNIPQPWSTEKDVQLGLCGHNHHKGWDNPYTQGCTDMYIANFTEYTTFNLICVDSSGDYTVENNLAAIQNPEEDPSRFRPNLVLDFARANDGSTLQNTATIVNHFELGFPEARIRFIMPKGQYTLSNGRIEQVIENDTLSVVDVRIRVEAKSTSTIEIQPESKTKSPEP